jgi:16S rRNA (cytidine1402-2'-O)-methyltransferase
MTKTVSEVELGVSNQKGVLYIVATPIGNLGDIGSRAAEILSEVDLIAAEDTRHSGKLLKALGINAPLTSLHEHNERHAMASVLSRLESGEAVALISDAGTPLISDPGFPLVREARLRGIKVVPVPGPSAVICALSAAGLPTDRFLFEGFPPRTSSARKRRFEKLRRENATLVFYESPHRVLETLEDMAAVFRPARRAVLARELTKLHETFIDAPLGELVERVRNDADQQKGEIVLLVEGAGEPDADNETVGFDIERLLAVLVKELPLKRAAAVAAELTGLRKNDLYARALALKDN